ncbi:MAG: proline--tRNA ligase, partial [bacterium]
MLWTKAFFPTLKEEPREAETPSHRLLLRAGYIRMLMSGVYIYLPLGLRSINKIAEIIREEMNKIGAQELLMPAINPIEIWDATGRNEAMGDEMFRVKDRKGRVLCLAPTHEEIIAFIASREIRSYRELPQVWYQIQTKFRDEPRPRSGILRVREFFMKDSYTLAANKEQLDKSYEDHAVAYRRIFTRCGLKFLEARASSGVMGGTESAEFMVPALCGEDIVIHCSKCNISSNAQVAMSIPQQFDNTPMKEELVYTPGAKTIDEVSTFLGLPPQKLVKSLLYMSERYGAVMFLVRGDYELSLDKAMQIVGAIRPCEPEEVLRLTGAQIGYIGPFGLKGVKFFADNSVGMDYIFATGANKDEYHITGKKLSELDDVTIVDIHMPKEGDFCPNCGEKLTIIPAIE